MLSLPAHIVEDVSLDTCAFISPDGSKCQLPKRSRGYCPTHYKALQRSKAFTPVLPLISVPGSKENVDHNSRIIRNAHRKLIRSTPKIVDVLLDGMRIAAKKGDTSAAQWALLHSRVIQPIATIGKNGESNNGGVTINVGVKVSGAKPDPD